MVGYKKDDHKTELLAQLHKARRFLRGALKVKGIRVANLAKLVADSGAGWADGITAHLGAYQEMVAGLITEIPARLAEKANDDALHANSGSKRPGDTWDGRGAKYQRRGGGHHGRDDGRRGRGSGERFRTGHRHYNY